MNSKSPMLELFNVYSCLLVNAATCYNIKLVIITLVLDDSLISDLILLCYHNTNAKLFLLQSVAMLHNK